MNGVSQRSNRKSRRTAVLYNLVLPGAGQILLGQRLLGIGFAVPFLACIIAKLVIAVAGLERYYELAASEMISFENFWTQLAEVFRIRALLILLLLTIVIVAASLLSLYLAPPRQWHSSGNGEARVSDDQTTTNKSE